ncbi:MAG: Peptidase M23B [Clostridia bacterium 41_269]|nr:MAG: Peptidase M23B [Clostridia bacterium 41_269]
MIKRKLLFFTAAVAVSFSLILSNIPAGALIFSDILETIPAVHHEKNGSYNNTDGLKFEEYRVKAGDSLWKISRIFSSDWKQIAEVNGIKDGKYLQIGQILRIPVEEGKVHIVQKGDSLWKIAHLYGVDPSSLASANNIKNAKRLKVGMRIRIPEEKTVEAVSRSMVLSYRELDLNWPVEGPITSRFGPRSGEFHHGLDIAAEEGTKVYPVMEGRVIFSGWLSSVYGRTVIIKHDNNMKSLYAHNSKNLVKEGDYVTINTPISCVGSTGRTTGSHVHLEIHVDGEPEDPQKFLKNID